MTYRVKLDIFEGPLDLLLYLVEKEKINIMEISIAALVDQFMEYLSLMEELSLEIAGSFLVMAATLLEIKSRHLLPRLPDEITEEETETETALIERLLQYKQFKEAALLLSEKEGTASQFYVRNPLMDPDGNVKSIQIYREVSLFDLLTVLKDINMVPQPPKKFTPARSVANVMAIIESVRRRLSENQKLLFRDLLTATTGRDEVVALFLAILELMRLREVIAIQEYLFGEILLVCPEILLSCNDSLAPYRGSSTFGAYESLAERKVEDPQRGVTFPQGPTAIP